MAQREVFILCTFVLTLLRWQTGNTSQMVYKKGRRLRELAPTARDGMTQPRARCFAELCTFTAKYRVRSSNPCLCVSHVKALISPLSDVQKRDLYYHIHSKRPISRAWQLILKVRQNDVNRQGINRLFLSYFYLISIRWTVSKNECPFGKPLFLKFPSALHPFVDAFLTRACALSCSSYLRQQQRKIPCISLGGPWDACVVKHLFYQVICKCWFLAVKAEKNVIAIETVN